MPIYAYRCTNCGHAQDVLQKMSDPVLTVCPACGQPTYAKQVTAAGFQLKGSGWYVTDFRGDGKAGAKKADADAGEAKGDGAKGDAKGDAKADAAPASGDGKAAAAPAPAAAASPAPSPAPAPSASPAAAPPSSPTGGKSG